MNKRVLYAFLIGAALGTIAARHYAKRMKVESDDICEEDYNYVESNDVLEPSASETDTAKDISDVQRIIEQEEYVRKPREDPYIIYPEEFGAVPGYETVSLNYFSDNVLADEDDVIVDDIDNTVGVHSLNHFGEYADDSVYVRNERKKCDYEILRDVRRYADVIEQRPMDF